MTTKKSQSATTKPKAPYTRRPRVDIHLSAAAHEAAKDASAAIEQAIGIEVSVDDLVSVTAFGALKAAHAMAAPGFGKLLEQFAPMLSPIVPGRATTATAQPPMPDSAQNIEPLSVQDVDDLVTNALLEILKQPASSAAHELLDEILDAYQVVMGKWEARATPAPIPVAPTP